MIEQQRNGPCLKPKDLCPSLSPDVDAVILKGWAYDKDKEVKKLTTIKGQGKVIVALAKLNHQ